MPRRLPTFAPLAVAAAVGLFALTSALTAQAPNPAAPAAAPAAGADPLKAGQEENFELYKKFSDKLLELAQKWEKSDNPEDKERAKTIRTALKIADERGVKNLFKDLVEGLANPNQSGDKVNKLIGQDAKLIAALREVLATLQSDDEATKLAKDIANLKELIKAALEIKRGLEVGRAQTENPRSDANRIARDINDLANRTKNLADRFGNKDTKGDQNKGAGGGEKPDPKSDPKAEPKPGETPADMKSDTGEDKSSGKEPNAGDTPPKGAPNAGEPKPNDGKGTNPEAGSDKPTPKDGQNDGAKGVGDPKPMPRDPKPGDPKPGEPRPSDGESKNQGEGKGQPKPSSPQAGEGKPMGGGKESTDSQANAKPPSGSQGTQGQPGQSNPNAKKDPAQQGLEDAVPPQRGASEDLKKNQREDASKKTDDAIQKLEDVIKELEKRLAQLRDKEKLKKLENLEQRIARMLSQQIEVRDATKTIEDRIKATKQKTTAEVQKAQAQADKEAGIIAEADKAMQLIEGDGSAVVFAGVLGLTRQDMQAVYKQLEKADTGEATLLLEDQIITQLQKMLEALKKAQQDLKNPPPPPPPGQPNPNQGNQSLIKLIEQLKLLRELQLQVNERTVVFGKLAMGEQATDPFLQDQLKQLSERQKLLQDMLHKIASGEIQ
jgi:hypothetical protein